MPSSHRQPFVFAAIVLAVLAAKPHPSRLARADDPAKSPHESAVLDRIFANWKARHDRVHSLHMTWDRHLTFLRSKEEFDQFGRQVFFDGDRRYCIVEPPMFELHRAKPTNARRVFERMIIDGDTSWLYRVGSLNEKDSANPEFSRKPFGVVRTIPAHPTLSAIQAIWLTFRPEFPELSWRRDRCRVVDENATIDGVHCVKIQRVIEPAANALQDKTRFESLWVSPVRDDVVVHWTAEAETFLMKGTIRYNKDPKFGWVPSEWTSEILHNLEECRVTDYSINEKIDPSVFSHQFPPGTPVQDQRGLGKPGKPDGLRHYIVEQDGSERAISIEDYFRFSALRASVEKRAAEKPQGAAPAGK